MVVGFLSQLLVFPGGNVSIQEGNYGIFWVRLVTVEDSEYQLINQQ